MTSDYTVNLNFDTYINLFIKNVHGEGINSNHLCSFKTQLNGDWGSILYTDEFSTYRQKITLYGEKTYSDFQIQFIDRLGNQIVSNNNQHFSLTFRIIYEE
jgi:hypothetical protein